MTDQPPIARLEQYTFRVPQEVLLVTARVDDDEDYVVVFRGFSSSLVNPTAPDPEIPVLPAEAVIESIDRLQGPYTPDNPQYLEQNIDWEAFSDRLAQMGL
ncbi:hypothetical protein PN498_12410 [Oscillatoria sp. CS-180]|uniref:DUF7734 family protein n=1 Tax=Oscillatoria sp. CS-180 TaxID=3021720 RepID=UPI00232C1CD0|nr:hypothetical protein [Oscillatoria sp. CS-180]MDB9526794.1 hypothetical protein [Oscillatoria sp. CS-180]